MRITKIEIKHFRAFPGPGTYTFDLPNGENLLLYGENGSGKSSLFHALDQLFNISQKAPTFSELANLFARDEKGQEINDGFIKVHLDDASEGALIWEQTGSRPDNQILVDAAMRKGSLDYRRLLRTTFSDGNLEESFFRFAVEVLLEQIPVAISGSPRPLGEYWRSVHLPRNHRKWNLESVTAAINSFQSDPS
jgi:energy-coupling factor transporter ATP-binding protein EcfA2